MAPKGGQVTAETVKGSSTVVSTSTVRPSVQYIRVPVPGSTVYIEVRQECPEVVYSTSATGEGVVTRPAASTLRESGSSLWRLAVGVGATLPPVEWDVRAGVRIGTVFGLGWGVYGAVGGPVTGWVPSRYGAGLTLIF